MKIKFLFLVFIFPIIGSAQGINNLWQIGYYGGRIPTCCGGGMSLDFAGGSLTISQDTLRIMGFGETNGVICDKNGNLLFSSNGVWIANAFNDTMLNGYGLNPSFYTSSYAHYGLYITQANLIIPFPGDSNKYYLFHQTVDDPGTSCSFYLYYSVIDMTGDGGKGAVINKNHILLNDSLVSGGLTACKHANGRDWWLIAHKFRKGSNQFFSASNLYYKYLITPLGIAGPDTQSIGMPRVVASGQTVFSPDGKYYAVYETFNIDIFNFDRCTGTFSLKTNFNVRDSATADGVAFSANSQLLYVSSGKYLDQFDMNAADIEASRTTILTASGGITGFFLSQLAPDGKIYSASAANVATMHVVNNPDVRGVGCNACADCVVLPALNAWTVPNHPNYFLGAETGSVCDSLTSLTPFLSKGEGVLNIYPNPSVTEDVTFTYTVSSEQGTLYVYNIEGKEVIQYSIPQWSSVQHLKLPKMAEGIYMARLAQGKSISSVKFIKE